jgi:hypothetical protein
MFNLHLFGGLGESSVAFKEPMHLVFKLLNMLLLNILKSREPVNRAVTTTMR